MAAMARPTEQGKPPSLVTLRQQVFAASLFSSALGVDLLIWSGRGPNTVGMAGIVVATVGGLVALVVSGFDRWFLDPPGLRVVLRSVGLHHSLWQLAYYTPTIALFISFLVYVIANH